MCILKLLIIGRLITRLTEHRPLLHSTSITIHHITSLSSVDVLVVPPGSQVQCTTPYLICSCPCSCPVPVPSSRTPSLPVSCRQNSPFSFCIWLNEMIPLFPARASPVAGSRPSPPPRESSLVPAGFLAAQFLKKL